MKPESSALASLSAVIGHDLEAIQRMDMELQRLAPSLQAPDSDFRDLAAVGYTLHNLYNAMENSFDQISRTFENHVVNEAQWHKELLEKMFLEIPTVRPALLTESLRKLLNDLRGFRHLFRHGYDFDLDVERLRTLVARWNAEKSGLTNALAAFRKGLLPPAE